MPTTTRRPGAHSGPGRLVDETNRQRRPGATLRLGCPHWQKTFPPASQRHQGAVYSTAFSPDGQWVVSGGKMGQSVSGAHPISSHSSFYLAMPGALGRWASARMGRRSSRAVMTARCASGMWPVASRWRNSTAMPGAFCRWASARMGRRSSRAVNSTVRIWDVASGQQVAQLDGHAGRVWSVGFSPDGAQIVSGGDDGTVRIWDVASGAAGGATRRP